MIQHIAFIKFITVVWGHCSDRVFTCTLLHTSLGSSELYKMTLDVPLLNEEAGAQRSNTGVKVAALFGVAVMGYFSLGATGGAAAAGGVLFNRSPISIIFLSAL